MTTHEADGGLAAIQRIIDGLSEGLYGENADPLNAAEAALGELTALSNAGPETLDGMTIHEWRDTAQGAIRRISSAERAAGLTQRQHMRAWLPEVKDRVLHPYPRPKVYDRAAVLGAFLQIEAEISPGAEETK